MMPAGDQERPDSTRISLEFADLKCYPRLSRLRNFPSKGVKDLARLLLLAGLVLLLSTSGAQAIIIEAESFVASHNAGGSTITVVSCSGASGGYAVEGFDTPGDWIEMILNVPEIYGYADSLRSAGEYGFASDIRSTIFGADPNGWDVLSTYHTMGQGIG